MNGSIRCKFFDQGHCIRGESCKFAHISSDANKSHTSAGPIPYPVSSNTTEEFTCGICDEIVTPSKRFGLLENCDHVFCLSCIRSWRTQREHQDKENLRKCPICRVESYQIIPSSRYLRGAEKAPEAGTYRTNLRRIPCKYFDRSKGLSSCPFGASCFYGHLNADGTEAANGRGVPTSVTFAEGREGRAVLKEAKLSDFLEGVL